MQHINSYLEYCHIVGDNGGILMSEKQFQQYKKEHSKLTANRLFSSWINSNGQNCKNIGLTSKCFCDHFYKNHEYLNQTNNKIKCKTVGCKCSDYVYIPIYGSQDFKCTCKHSYQLHDVGKKNCKSCPCKAFQSNWNCSCGNKFSQHQTISKRQSQNQKTEVSNHPVQGKITSYSSMLDGADRHQQNIKKQVKKQGLKIGIEQFKIGDTKLKQSQKSCWQLYNSKISWLK